MATHQKPLEKWSIFYQQATKLGLVSSQLWNLPPVLYVCPQNKKGNTAEKAPQILDVDPCNRQTKQQPDSRSNSSTNKVSNIHSRKLNSTLKFNNFKVIVALTAPKSLHLETFTFIFITFWRALIPILNWYTAREWQDVRQKWGQLSQNHRLVWVGRQLKKSSHSNSSDMSRHTFN